MGAGKSSIGKKLAHALNYRFIELDELILQQTGYSTIDEVYSKKASLWRECELEVSKDLSLEDGLVVACGGGFVENELNITYFREHSKNLICIYLQAGVETLARRTYEKLKLKGSDVNLAKIEASVKKIFSKREFLYKSYADMTIATDNKEIDSVAHELSFKLPKMTINE